MTKLKTSELTGAALDWAVAKSVYINVAVCKPMGGGPQVVRTDGPGGVYIPSTAWTQGGPLIEAFHVEVESNLVDEWAGSVATEDPDGEPGWVAKVGPTPLTAASRAIVAAKLGDEVDVPEELA